MQVIVERLLRVARPAHQPAHVAGRERVGVFGSEVARRIERAVGNHHLHGHAAAGDRRIQLVGVLHADAGAAGEDARAARRRAVRDAQLRVLAVGHDVLGVELAVGHHLRERHHGRGVGPDRVRRDDVDVGVLGGLRRRDAAVHPHRLLLSCASDWWPCVLASSCPISSSRCPWPGGLADSSAPRPAGRAGRA